MSRKPQSGQVKTTHSASQLDRDGISSPQWVGGLGERVVYFCSNRLFVPLKILIHPKVEYLSHLL